MAAQAFDSTAHLYRLDARKMSWWRRLFSGRGEARRDGDPEPFRQAWLQTLYRGLPIYRRFPRDQRPVLHRLIQEFLDAKTFWGAEDLAVTDEMKVLIAAQACLMVVNLPRLGLYPKTKEIIVYPSEFGESVEAIGPDGRVYHIDDARIGETWHRGPVLLAWDGVSRTTRSGDDGHNTVFHEFAHALDFLDGAADGVPPLESREQHGEWLHVLRREYERLVSMVRRGRRSFIDPYGAEDPAEFFAVATEQFFEQPRRFHRAHRALYGQLQRFYGQDPAAWR